MSNGAAAAAAAGAAARAKAIKATGAIVQVSPDDFRSLVARAQGALVVTSEGGMFSRYKYLLGYKGFAFVTKTSDPIQLPSHVETVHARKIWVP